MTARSAVRPPQAGAMADAAAANPADRTLFGRIVALVEGRRRGSAGYVLPPACALLFLRMSPERDPDFWE
jgi:hypothetical protein